MAATCRPWWRNCALEADPEMTTIDSLADAIAPLNAGVSKIRELISNLELCHHKAERWISNIIEAIGTGETNKGLGTRAPGQQHPAEQTWKNACAALTAWGAGCPVLAVEGSIDTSPAFQILNCLGQRTTLMEWQVQRLIEKIRSLINWPWSVDDPSSQYTWLLLSDGDHESVYRRQCPERYKEHEDFWLTTVRTMIHDTENGEATDLSLALAIDMLWPCHWRFVENLRIVLGAIGGRLNPQKPFAACGRNIALLPAARRVEVVANTLANFCGVLQSEGEADNNLLLQLGKPTTVRKWLAASLAKTIRLQLYPPDELRALSALGGPDWIRQ